MSSHLETATIDLSPFESLKRSSRWLSHYAHNVYSQTGEDGILAKALELLPARDRWCVEFGAWDGIHLSNTFNLVKEQDYRVVLIEGNEAKYKKLCSDYPYRERGSFVHAFVGWGESDGLDALLASTPIPLDFDFLSVDVDGNDYHIWNATKRYRPKLVLIEYNPTSSNRFDFVQAPEPSLNQCSSPAAMVRLAKEKGYELIAVTELNLLFVDARYYPHYGIPDNALAVMRDEHDVTSLYLGQNGSLVVDGPALLRWHGEPLKVAQPLPSYLQAYPPNYTRWQSYLFQLRQLFRR